MANFKPIKPAEVENDELLLVAVFKEIAVVQGKRTPDGQWTDAKVWDIQVALETAMRVVNSARTAAKTPKTPAA